MTGTLEFSDHGSARMNQRGKRKSDVELILRAGSSAGKEGFILLNKDIDREIRIRKREIQALERLRNVKVVARHDLVVTCYDTTPKHRKRLMCSGLVSD